LVQVLFNQVLTYRDKKVNVSVFIALFALQWFTFAP
jgi:hypothetical protein